jgi:hypothetical protein
MRIPAAGVAGVFVLACVASQCAPKSRPSRTVQESDTAPRASADPALREEMFRLLAPPPPGSGQIPDRNAAFGRIQWQPVAIYDLGPGEVRVFKATRTQSFSVFVRAGWRGGEGPLSILVTGAGATITSGVAIKVEANRGVATATGSVGRPGIVDVVIRNAGTVSLHVQTVVGIL